MKSVCLFFILFSFCANAQYSLKVKKEDNRLIFFKAVGKNDTIIRNKTDLFYIKFPDNNKENIQINVVNGQFIKTDNDTIFRLRPVQGMKYSHSKPDSVFNTLVEGNCMASKNILIELINTQTQQRLFQHNFIAK